MRILLSLCCLAVSVAAQDEPRQLLESRTKEKLLALVQSTEGIVGISAIDLTDGHEICLHCATLFPTASTIKVPILAEVIRQGKMEEAVRISSADIIEGSKEFEAALSRGTEAKARDLALMMIRSSDNAATNRLIDLVGMAAVNRLMGELDLPGIRLRRKMIDSAAAARNEENVATPREMARLAAKLHRGEVVNAPPLPAFFRSWNW
jgi:beta-lactamase class A